MLLRGLTAGPAVWREVNDPAGGTGQVAAVYRRSLLWFAAPDQPLTLSLDSRQRGPLVLDAEGPLTALTGVSPGLTVHREGELLRFGPALTVDLSGVTAWDPTLPTLEPGSAARLARAIRHELSRRAPEDGLGALVSGPEPYTGWAATAAPSVALLRRGELGGAVGGLIGLGPGLTPAGDDFLAGVLAGLQTRQDPRSELLAEAIRAAIDRTTAISRQFLTCALKGYYGESVRAVFCTAGEEGPAADALAELLAVGATSGADTAAGIYVGLTLEEW